MNSVTLQGLTVSDPEFSSQEISSKCFGTSSLPFTKIDPRSFLGWLPKLEGSQRLFFHSPKINECSLKKGEHLSKGKESSDWLLNAAGLACWTLVLWIRGWLLKPGDMSSSEPTQFFFTEIVGSKCRIDRPNLLQFTTQLFGDEFGPC